MYILVIIISYVKNVTNRYIYLHNHGKYETDHWNQHKHSVPLIVIVTIYRIMAYLSHHTRILNTLASPNLHQGAYRMIKNKQNNKRMPPE